MPPVAEGTVGVRDRLGAGSGWGERMVGAPGGRLRLRILANEARPESCVPAHAVDVDPVVRGVRLDLEEDGLAEVDADVVAEALDARVAPAIHVPLGRALVALSTVAWSTAGIFTKGVEADVWTVLLWRGVLAGGVMSAWLVWRRGQAGLADWKHPGWAGWSAATVSSAATICFIAAFKNTALEVPLAPLWS